MLVGFLSANYLDEGKGKSSKERDPDCATDMAGWKNSAALERPGTAHTYVGGYSLPCCSIASFSDEHVSVLFSAYGKMLSSLLFLFP